MIVRRISALLLIASSIALLTVACEGGQLGTPSATGAVVQPTEEASPTDDTTGNGQDPPTLAPVPPGVKAGPKCDAAFKAWVDWWVASTGPDESVDPNADPAADSVLPSGDPNKLDHALFSSCTLAELGAANAAHPVVLDPTESPAPYIPEEIGSYVAGLCADEPDVIGDTKLCKAVPSPSP